MKLVGYARVSTEEQSLELQRTALRNAGCHEIFEDFGISGATATRRGLTTALERVKGGDTLVVWRLDRLGRSLAHLISTINRLEKRGVHFKSLNESIDTSSSGGRLVFHIMGAMAEFERALISERTRAGMRAAKRQGQHLGRPPAFEPEKHFEILGALERGETRRSVAERYGVSLRTVDRLKQKPPADEQSCLAVHATAMSPGETTAARRATKSPYPGG
jgi:DNA invertase Pin-like site-specific DNA recombinase